MKYSLILLLSLSLACAAQTARLSSDPVEHLGFVFPNSVGELRLNNFHEYDDPRFGAVANYRTASSPSLIVSVYIFPEPRFQDGSAQRIEDHAKDELQGLVQHYPGSRIIEWPPEIEYSNRAGRQFYRAALEIEHANLGKAYSLLGLTQEGSSRIKFRISYAPEEPGAALAIRTFFAEFP